MARRSVVSQLLRHIPHSNGSSGCSAHCTNCTNCTNCGLWLPIRAGAGAPSSATAAFAGTASALSTSARAFRARAQAAHAPSPGAWARPWLGPARDPGASHGDPAEHPASQCQRTHLRGQRRARRPIWGFLSGGRHFAGLTFRTTRPKPKKLDADFRA